MSSDGEDGRDRSRSPPLRKFRDVGEENPRSAKAPKEKKVDDSNSKACRAKMGKDRMGWDHERVECIGLSDQRNSRLSDKMGSKVIVDFTCTEEARHALKEWVSSDVERPLKNGYRESGSGFYDIPLELWSAIGLSYIASMVGKPLGIDRITEDSCGDSLGRMGSARILVERPSQCGRCRVFGHTDELCPYQPRTLERGNTGGSVRNEEKENDVFIKVSRGGKGNKHIGRKEKATVISRSQSDFRTNKVIHQGGDKSSSTLRIVQKDGNHTVGPVKLSKLRQGIRTGCWNIRGLNQSIKQEEVGVFIKEKKLALCSLLETRVASVNTNIVGMTDQVVNCVVRELWDGNEFLASFVYVVNDLVGRKELWDNLRNHKYVVGNSLWIVMGDFNATHYLNESLGGLNIITTTMKEFKDCVDEIEIEDISQEVSKLESLKPVLRDLNRKQGNLSYRVEILRKEVEVIQSALD
ncbi:hypothetical protein Pint_33152 [Pistacia integerrima]|uniref:Uncharacterized protein n=1 Tax=Pistacia integerrima TaxID=434235 RepID=A0ACC0X8D1_9ROSI|nr:hypothetical protein Pint_33152 [Pistacia integerrima]